MKSVRRSDVLSPRLQWGGAAFVFVLTQVVYLLTLTVSCPFWDSGEYIATSYTLGIPHPPGTPLYVLIGRVISMVPLFEEVSTRVNYLSALASSLCAAVVYLTTFDLYARMASTDAAATARTKSPAAGSGKPVGSGAPGQTAKSEAGDDSGGTETALWRGVVGGVFAACFAAFGSTFWNNAIEAEVYALSSFLMALVFWLTLRWERQTDPGRRFGYFLLIYYLSCLSMGIHLGTFLVLPGVLLYMLLVDRRLFATQPVAAVIVAALVLLLHPGLLPTIGAWPYGIVFGGTVLAILLSSVAQWSRGRGLHPALAPRGILAGCVVVALIGVSTHAYLPIRASLDPMINEGDPSTWERLWQVLVRDQYKPPNPFTFRKASFFVQFKDHFFDYAAVQYALGIGIPWLGALVPYLFGLGGGWAHATRERRTFAFLAVVYLICTVGLVFYLNFQEDEVRARDYFFVASYHFFAIWIGLGASALLDLFRGSLSKLAGVAAVVLLCLPANLIANQWFAHDRTEFHVAEDYARNMLGGLGPNAILFTNGDNDTFPLFYLQEVEGFRQDVRVVNLSLLNTDWYLEQVQEYEPSVDLGWDEQGIYAAVQYPLVQAMSQAGYGGWNEDRQRRYLMSTGLSAYVPDLKTPVLTRDLAVARIVEREYGRRPLHIAVTVPDAMGLDERMVMQGLTFEIRDRIPGEVDRIDIEKTQQLLHDVYSFRGLVDEQGNRVSDLYLDRNTVRLAQNYAAALLQVSGELFALGREEEARENVRLALALPAERGSSTIYFSLGILYLRASKYAEAEEALAEAARLGSADLRVFRYLGRSQELQGELDAAELNYIRAWELDRDNLESTQDLFSYLWEVRRKRREAIALLEDWMKRHPRDMEVAAVLREYEDSLRTFGSEESEETR